MTEEKELTKISEYMGSNAIRARFADVVGKWNAAAYISSVMIAVANSDELQKCTLASIYTSALRAATLRLSVDPGLGQAYLVPFGQVATLIVGYKGLVDMATRTGQYRYINVTEINAGEEVIEDRITGWHSIAGSRTSNEVIGWLASFKLVTGFAKTLYMNVEEIHEHAAKYSKTYKLAKGSWTTETRKMQRKTVLRLLLRRWGYLDPSDSAVLDEIENGVIEGEIVQPEVEQARKSEAQIMDELGYEPGLGQLKPEPEQLNIPLADMLVGFGLFESTGGAEHVIKSLALDKLPIDEAVFRARGYRGWRDLGATSEQAVKSIKAGEYPK